MTDGPGRGAGKRGLAAVELRVAARLENLAVLRTLVGAVGTFADLDLDSVADLRLRSMRPLIRSASPGTSLIVVVDPRDDDVVVEAGRVRDRRCRLPGQSGAGW